MAKTREEKEAAHREGEDLTAQFRAANVGDPYGLRAPSWGTDDAIPFIDMTGSVPAPGDVDNAVPKPKGVPAAHPKKSKAQQDQERRWDEQRRRMIESARVEARKVVEESKVVPDTSADGRIAELEAERGRNGGGGSAGLTREQDTPFFDMVGSEAEEAAATSNTTLGSATEGSNDTALTTTWVHAEDNLDGLHMYVVTRLFFDHTASTPVLYAYARKMIFNGYGRLLQVEAEQRYEVDTPVA